MRVYARSHFEKSGLTVLTRSASRAEALFNMFFLVNTTMISFSPSMPDTPGVGWYLLREIDIMQTRGQAAQAVCVRMCSDIMLEYVETCTEAGV